MYLQRYYICKGGKPQHIFLIEHQKDIETCHFLPIVYRRKPKLLPFLCT